MTHREIDGNRELKVYGLANAVIAASVGTPAYMQLKFSSLNFGITHHLQDRLPLLICALFNAVMFVIDLSVVDVLPRLLFAGLLFFGGLGFGKLSMVEISLAFVNQYVSDGGLGPG